MAVIVFSGGHTLGVQGSASLLSGTRVPPAHNPAEAGQPARPEPGRSALPPAPGATHRSVGRGRHRYRRWMCRVRQVLELGDAERASNNLVVALIVRIHVRDDAIEGDVPSPAAFHLVARMSAEEWCTTRDDFTLPPRRRSPRRSAELRRRWVLALSLSPSL
jgi:hypothetical protein